MGAVRLSFVTIVALGAMGASGAFLVPFAVAQDAVPRAEPRPEPPARPEPPSKAEPQSKPVPKAQPKRGAAPSGTVPAPAASERDGRAAPAPSCGWIGKRVIQSLLRDDAVTAQDFDRLYRTFECPGDYLRLAFDCTVSDGAPQTAQETLIRVDGCWSDLKFDTKVPKIQLQSNPSPSPAAPGVGATQPKGAATGKAQAPAATTTTPNYTKGK